MLPGELKPILTALVLPPTAPLLLALLGVLVALRRRGPGLGIVVVALASAYLLSTEGVALAIARQLTPAFAPASLEQVRRADAIVVLGGGVELDAPQYGIPQLGRASGERLRYGAFLARRTGRPLAYSGGPGWAHRADQEPEAVIAVRVAQQDYGIPIRWVEDSSRDTAENADRSARLLARAGVRRVAVVTDAIHMARAVAEFRRAGFEVVPAPTSFPQEASSPVLEWLPSPEGLALARYALREWLGRQVARLR